MFVFMDIYDSFLAMLFVILSMYKIKFIFYIDIARIDGLKWLRLTDIYLRKTFLSFIGKVMINLKAF